MSPSDQDPRPLLEGGARSADDGAVTDLLARLPRVETDELSVERSWRRIQATRGQPRRRLARWAPVAVAGAAALALVAIRIQRATRLDPLAHPARATVQLTSGDVRLADPRGGWESAAVGRQLASAALVQTGGHGRAVLQLERGSALLSPQTDLGLEALGATTFLRLNGGTLLVALEPRNRGETFVVQTTRFHVTVKGTIFEVRERTPADLLVSVHRGVVDVAGPAEGPNRHWQVSAGHAWWSLAPETDAPDSIAAVDLDLLDGASSRTGESQAGLPSDPQGRDTPPATASGAQPTGPAAQPVMAAAEPAPTATHATPPDSPGLRAPAVRRSELAPRELAASSMTASAIDGYARALALDHESRFREAATALAEVVAQAQPCADLALYRLAQLEQHELGDPAAALRDYQRYALIYPAGALAQEAALSSIDLQAQQATPASVAAALTDSERFLAAHPDSERSPELHLLRGNLWRQRGEFNAALNEYRQTNGTRAEADADYFTATCDQALGQHAQAAAALRVYLARYPQGAHAREARAALESSDDR